MRNSRSLIVAGMMLTALSSGAAAADDDADWGWQVWGWGRGPGAGMMMGQGGGGFMGRMGAIDTNHDGVIGDDEAAAQVEAVFLAMDGDDDGELTEDEYMAGRMGLQRGFNEERQKAMQERKKARFGEMDSDRNGRISKAEFIAAGKSRFEAADTDKDGKVTPWEFRAQHWAQ